MTLLIEIELIVKIHTCKKLQQSGASFQTAIICFTQAELADTGNEHNLLSRRSVGVLPNQKQATDFKPNFCCQRNTFLPSRQWRRIKESFARERETKKEVKCQKVFKGIEGPLRESEGHETVELWGKN